MVCKWFAEKLNGKCTGASRSNKLAVKQNELLGLSQISSEGVESRSHNPFCFNCHSPSIRTSWVPWQKGLRAIDRNVPCYLFMNVKGQFSFRFFQNNSDSEILLDATCPKFCLNILQRNLFWVGLPEIQLIWKTAFTNHSPGKCLGVDLLV